MDLLDIPINIGTPALRTPINTHCSPQNILNAPQVQMSTRHHVDPWAANPTVVPQFPRPFDGNKTAPPQVLAIDPALTIGRPRTPDEIIDVDAIPDEVAVPVSPDIILVPSMHYADSVIPTPTVNT